MTDKFFIPTLTAGTSNTITSKNKTVEYLVAFSLITPANAFEGIDDMIVSMSSILATHANNLDNAVDEYSSKMTGLLDDYDITATVETHYEIDTTDYNVTIVVNVVDNTTGDMILSMENMINLLDL